MSRSRSFRSRLARRFCWTLGISAALVCVGAYALLRIALYERLDGLVLRLATIEAAATADSPDESVHFHDAVFAMGPGASDHVLARYAEVWTVAGESVVQTRNLGTRHLSLPNDVRLRVITSDQPQLFSLTFEGQGYRSVLYPLGLVGPKHQAHLLQVAISTVETTETLAHAARLLSVLAMAGFAVGALLGWFLAGYAVRPVLDIIREAEQMDAAGRGHRIAVETNTSELQRLIAVLNSMLWRIDRVLEGQRQFLADAGHAIKTPLTILRGDIDVALRKERTPDDYRRVLGQSLEDLRATSTLAEDLITLARTDAEPKANPDAIADVGAVIDSVHHRYEAAAARAGARLIAERPPARLFARVDTEQLERALGNVVDNAVKYSSATRIILTAATIPERTVSIAVSDDGVGIPPLEQVQIFERFFRGAVAREQTGTGLGLPIARGLLESAGGSISLNSSIGAGAVFRFLLPAADDDKAAIL